MTTRTRPTHWPSIPPEQAEEAWADLKAWVGEMVERFGIDSRTLPSCWFRHNALVEALSALRDHEVASYLETFSAATAVDWLRALRDVVDLMREFASRTGCTAGQHRDESRTGWSASSVGWEDFVAGDVVRRAAVPDLVGDAPDDENNGRLPNGRSADRRPRRT